MDKNYHLVIFIFFHSSTFAAVFKDFKRLKV